MPATPAHQDPLQDTWRLEELTPDVRRRLFAGRRRIVHPGPARVEGPGRLARWLHTERPRSA